MKKLILSALIIASVVSPVAAKQEVQVTRTLWEMSDFPGLDAKVKTVCEGTMVKSDKLKEACKDQTKMPKITKAGAFRNTGIGAELNALIRQQVTSEAK
jgi:hypothetical protein